MKNENVYIRAARVVHRTPGFGLATCLAIVYVDKNLGRLQYARRSYDFLFHPAEVNCICWGQQWGDLFNSSDAWTRKNARQVKQCRILALCLMAAIDEAGDA